MAHYTSGASDIASYDFVMPLRGDLDGNGQVNSSDVSALVAVIMGSSNIDHNTADLDGNGQVNSSDVSALISIILGQ